MTRPTGLCSAHQVPGSDSTCETCWPPWAWHALPGLAYKGGTGQWGLIQLGGADSWIVTERVEERIPEPRGQR